MPAALVHSADDHPAAVIDPAGERKLAGDAITAVDRRNAGRRQDRCCDGKVKTVGPDRLLCILGELADVMRVMDHQASAPSVRCVRLADFAHHFEPSVEAKAITPEPRRDENAGDARGEQRVNRFTRYCPRLFRCGGTVSDAHCQPAYLGKDLLMRLDRVTPTLARHYAPAFIPSIIHPRPHNTEATLQQRYCPRRLIIPRLRRSAGPIFAAGRWYRSRLDLCPVPNLPGDGGNQLEFAPLLFFRQRIAAPRGSKTALRAERKLFERQVVCGLIDLSHDLVTRL